MELSGNKRTFKATLTSIKKNRIFYIFLLPALITVLVFNYRPMVGVVMAFQNFTAKGGLYNSEWVGLAHFREFIKNPSFIEAFKNTLVLNGLVLFIGFPMPILFALLINEIKAGTFKKVTQTITYLPHFISWVIIAGMVYRMLDMETGSINYLIILITGQPVDFLKNADYFYPMIVTLSIWKELGWNSIIYLAAIAGLDPQLYEAATIDGAGRFKRMIYITLPGITPVIGLLLILSVGSLVSGANFDAVFNLKNGYLMSKANILDYYTYKEGVFYQHFSYATAIGLTQSLIAFVLVFSTNALSRRFKGEGAF